MDMTEEQKERMERNRALAIQRQRIRGMMVRGGGAGGGGEHAVMRWGAGEGGTRGRGPPPFMGVRGAYTDGHIYGGREDMGDGWRMEDRTHGAYGHGVRVHGLYGGVPQSMVRRMFYFGRGEGQHASAHVNAASAPRHHLRDTPTATPRAARAATIPTAAGAATIQPPLFPFAAAPNEHKEMSTQGMDVVHGVMRRIEEGCAWDGMQGGNMVKGGCDQVSHGNVTCCAHEKMPIRGVEYGVQQQSFYLPSYCSTQPHEVVRPRVGYVPKARPSPMQQQQQLLEYPNGASGHEMRVSCHQQQQDEAAVVDVLDEESRKGRMRNQGMGPQTRRKGAIAMNVWEGVPSKPMVQSTLFETMRRYREQHAEGTRHDAIAGTRHDAIAGTRHDAIAGTRHDAIAGTRNDAIAGTRNDAIAGTRNGVLDRAYNAGAESYGTLHTNYPVSSSNHNELNVHADEREMKTTFGSLLEVGHGHENSLMSKQLLTLHGICSHDEIVPESSVVAAEKGRDATSASSHIREENVLDKGRKLLSKLEAQDDKSLDLLPGQRWPWLMQRRDFEGRLASHPGFDPRTLHIPERDFRNLKPFQKQYWSIKRENMDVVLFVRVGSFYELYDVDADVGIKAGLNPMGSMREANMWKVGCPVSSFGTWALKVLMLGHNVGRVEECRGDDEQDFDQTFGKILPRRLQQIYTPGTCRLTCWAAESNCQEYENHPIMALFEASDGLLAACVIDLSAGILSVAEWQETNEEQQMLLTLLTQTNPIEIVTMFPGQLSKDTENAISTFLPLVLDGVERNMTMSYLRRLESSKVSSVPDELREEIVKLCCESGTSKATVSAFLSSITSVCVLQAIWIAIMHLHCTRISGPFVRNLTIKNLETFSATGCALSGKMFLDSTAIRSLEVIAGPEGTQDGSLLSFLSQCTSTPGGRRCIKRWLLQPLFREGDIIQRLDTVEYLRNKSSLVNEFQAQMRAADDFEKLLPRAAQQADQLLSSMSALTSDQNQMSLRCFKCKDMFIFKRVLVGLERTVTQMFAFLESTKSNDHYISPIFCRISELTVKMLATIKPLVQITDNGTEMLENNDEPFILPPGLAEQSDKLYNQIVMIKSRIEDEMMAIAGLLSTSCRRSSPSAIRKKMDLKGEGQGVYIEVPTSMSSIFAVHGMLPESKGKRTTRFKPPTIVHFGTMLQGLQDTYNGQVCEVLVKFMETFLDQFDTFVDTSNALSEIDALISFSLVTKGRSGCEFVRPLFSSSESPELLFKGLWSPQLLLGKFLLTKGSRMMLQSNDVDLGKFDRTSMLITGANSGGKSTLLRTVCIATIMAQIGCFVPCEMAILTPVDRIMTRMGARDRLSAGESTFYIEMKETSAILRHATRLSLVVLDELGRGTSATEGEALATATLITLAQRCRNLFATHYHNINNDARVSEFVSKFHMPSEMECSNGHVKMFKLLPGPARKGSCGIYYAGKSGISERILHRATDISSSMESSGENEGDEGLHQEVLARVLQALRCTRNCTQGSLREYLHQAQEHVRTSIANEP